MRVVLVPARGQLSVLDYLAPRQGAARPGARVLVPVGSRRSMAVVTETADDSPHREKLKEVLAVLDDEPVLDATLLALVRWMAGYYLAPLGEAMLTALPGALRVETERCVRLASDGSALAPLLAARERGQGEEGGGFTSGDPASARVADEVALLRVLADGAAVPVASLVRQLGVGVEKTIARLLRRGTIALVERLKRETAPTRVVRLYSAADGVDPSVAERFLARRPALRRLYERLRAGPPAGVPAGELRDAFPGAAAKLRELLDVGLAVCREQEEYRSVFPTPPSPDRAVRLNAAQRDAVGAVCAALGSFQPFLLHGVTGSGKTEVYLRVLAAVLEAGRTALVLVPEISLTHQLVDRVRARFGDGVAVLHSQLGDGERWDQWRRIARGEAPIVIGARSAVFAPLRRLGVIIVDEEHDGSYKQGDGVHYHGRDVAVMRARMCACPVVLGSATPSMESHFNALSGRYRRLELPERVESRPLPEVEMVDLRCGKGVTCDGLRVTGEPDGRSFPGTRHSSPSPISPALSAALVANFAAKRQSLLFLNRRGFSNFMQCEACGDPIGCPNCSVTLTWHRQRRALECHYCDYSMAPPARCPTCKEDRLTVLGLGTEQLEAVVSRLLPRARVVRLDRDTTRRKGSQEAMLKAWAAGRYDVMIGTQMVTKGHDVPGVTLVGVVLADQSLNFPDFRAAEQTFQLLAQVAGRAGRGDDPGRVIVQTLQPHHYSLRAAAAHDFAAFAREELEARKELDYPPHARLVLVRFEGGNLEAVRALADEAGRTLRESRTRSIAVLGPAPAPLERLRQRHRWHILLRGRDGAALRRAAANLLDQFSERARKNGVRLVADVDPYNML